MNQLIKIAIKQEDKDLLLKDLCGRLPYGVKILVPSQNEREQEYKDRIDILYSVNGDDKIEAVREDYDFYVDEIKPFLFPLSSMTENQRKEFDQLLELKAINDEIDHVHATAFEVDFYNKHHFDWRGLIPMGLAIDATNLNIY